MAGYHFNATDDSELFDSDPYYVGLVTDGGFGSRLDNYTSLFSHELVETITDPVTDPKTGGTGDSTERRPGR